MAEKLENDLYDDLADEELLKQFQQHAQRIGHAAISWNFAHSVVFVIFGQLSKMPYENSQAVFFALKSDVQQRDITIALARTELADAPAVMKKAVAAISRFHELSTERNAIVHTIWTTPTKTSPIKSQTDTKLFYKGYDQDEVAERIEAFDDKVSAGQKALLKALWLIVQRDASRRKSS